MTDKHIMIDGVDISGRIFHSFTTMGYAGYNYCKYFERACECHNDCNYKQLKHKEQDLEGLNGVYRRGLPKQILQKISEVEDGNGN